MGPADRRSPWDSRSPEDRPTGSGKSTPLLSLLLNFLRNPGSRVVLFDRDQSSRILCEAVPEAGFHPLGLALQERNLEASASRMGRRIEGWRVLLASSLYRPRMGVDHPACPLGFLRGDEGTANRMALGRQPQWIVLFVELPPETAKSYRATLTTAGGKTLWEGEGLIPNADGTVTLSLDSGTLEPGPHRLRLTAVDAQGRTAPAGEIPFEVQRGAS